MTSMPPTIPGAIQDSQIAVQGKWTDADRQTILHAASYAFPGGHTVDFSTDADGWDFAIVTPSGDAFPIVMGWTEDGRVFVANRIVGAEEAGDTVAEAAELLRQMAAMGRI
jgi:hypothetical protein